MEKTNFDAKHFQSGWPVLESDWKELFGAEFDSVKGHKMWMVASDGTRKSG